MSTAPPTPGDSARYRLLGQVAVVGPNGPVRLGGPKQRSVLAALLLNANRVVPNERLLRLVWGDDPPPSVRGQIQVHISELRKLIGEPAIFRRPSGYLIEVAPGDLDLHRFNDALAQARADRDAGRAEAAVRQLRVALSMWHGPALAGVTEPFLSSQGQQMRERRLGALEELFDAELAAGRDPDADGELRRAIDEDPFRERLQSQLMLALHQRGRTAEALEVYANVRGRMVAELGIEPGALLQQTQWRLLSGESREQPVTVSPAVPRQLPADITLFAGRIAELSRLDALLAPPPEASAATGPVIVAIQGTAGVGKTALALHWAHRVRANFPDGQLYLNLRGFDPGVPAVSPAEATRGFLEALLAPTDRIPTSADSQAALYRSLLADKSVLIVLDNARDADQVRPLLPGSPGCVVVVTSRDQLAGLVAVDGAHPRPLDLLSPDEARELLDRRLGTRRVAAEPAAVDEIISGCARLPLALAIVAARAAANPTFALSALADELHEVQGGLDPFEDGEPTTDLRAVLSWSYHILSPAAARLFRLLGVHFGPDLAGPAAAGLAGLPLRQARRLLSELSRAHLITEQTPGRYAFHDLLRAYASELAGTDEPDDERRRALHRVLDYYLRTAHTAALLLEPRRDPIELIPAQDGVVGEQFDDAAAALHWFGGEHRALLAAIPCAFAEGFYSHAWQLAWTLSPFFNRQGNWEGLVPVQITALKAARRLAVPAGEAHTRRILGLAYAQLGRYDDAYAELNQALALSAGDRTGQANVHHNLSWVYTQQQRAREALAHAQQALELYHSAGHRAGEGRMRNAVGWMHCLLGNHRLALANCQQALTVLRDLDDRPGQASTWDSLGYIHHQLGQHDRALRSYQQALDLFRADGDRYHEADTLTHLGDTHRATAAGADEARIAWQQALTIFEELGHPGAEQARARLSAADADVSAAHLDRAAYG